MNRLAEPVVSNRLSPSLQIPSDFSQAIVLYDSPETHRLAERAYTKACMDSPMRPRSTWWKLSDLAEPAVLAGAASTAMRSDLFVVSVTWDDGLPLPFYLWVGAWLPHRICKPGALLAIIGRSENQCSNGHDPLLEYLRAVARQANLAFVAQDSVVRRELGLISAGRLNGRSLVQAKRPVSGLPCLC